MRVEPPRANILLGKVLDTKDPDALGRVQVSLYGFPTAYTAPWLPVIQPFVGASYGVHFLPEKDTTVVILRGFGDAQEGLFVLGAVYNAHTHKPFVTDATNNAIKEIRTTSGHALVFDDTADAEKITILTKDEKLLVEIDVKAGKIAVTASKEVVVTCAEGKVGVTAKTVELTGTEGVTVKDSPKVEVVGADTVDITGSKGVTIDGGSAITLTASKIEMK